MDHFEYRSGLLHCEGLDLESIASRCGTPSYIYSSRTALDHLKRIREAFVEIDPLICFSIKSCSNLAICRLLATAGSGMDVVSGGELFRALAAGCEAAKIVYAGVGKTEPEIEQALRAGIALLNIESEEEFVAVASVAKRLGIGCACALRVNPDVDPHTHRYTTTGKRESKFGVDIERAKSFFARFGKDPLCRLEGLHLHIGSPVGTTEPYAIGVRKALELCDSLAAEGHLIKWLDIGGGFAADYETGNSPCAADYAAVIVPLLRERVRQGLRVVLEPGRSIIANAGVLLTRVLYRKQSGDKCFAICDAGMNTLLRPSHYEAFHFAWPVRPAGGMVPPMRSKTINLPNLERVDVVGPLCETGDFLALDRRLPPMKQGDLLAIFAAGAYGMSMASRYNSVPLPAEVLVHENELRIIRTRETNEDLVRHESLEGLLV
ncbi:MAG: diaminopimelate decarboxylase [Phycisphaerales bacterium]|nr:diaminopimelate decarboxylase [Phycisphaerales bacterium]